MGALEGDRDELLQEISDALKALRDHLGGISQAAMSFELGWPENRVEFIERKKTNLTPARKAEIVARYGPLAESLPTVGRKQRTRQNLGGNITVTPEHPTEIAVIGSSISAGPAGIAYSDITETILLPYWGGDTERWGRPVVGESMLDEFQDGDIVIFESLHAEDGHGVHARKDGEDVFKVLRETPRGWELWPTNPHHSPFSAEGWQILGVCIQRRRTSEDRTFTDTRDYRGGFKWRGRKKS